MEYTELEFLEMRSIATECAGHIGLAVGKENFEPYFHRAMELSIQVSYWIRSKF